MYYSINMWSNKYCGRYSKREIKKMRYPITIIVTEDEIRDKLIFTDILDNRIYKKVCNKYGEDAYTWYNIGIVSIDRYIRAECRAIEYGIILDIVKNKELQADLDKAERLLLMKESYEL